MKIRKRRKQRKAPDAPKKALTPYIIFSKEIRPRIKASVEQGTKVTEIVRIIAEKWAAMTDEEKAPYVKLAEEDKLRYSREMNAYDGPLHVPVAKKRGHQNKAPGAPKRAMSPFLFFSNEKRGQIQAANPNMKITEVSAKLGEIWRDMTDEEKEPYVQKSREDRNRYHAQQDEFRGKNNQQAAVKVPSSISVPMNSELSGNQWSISLNEGTSSAMYQRMYDISPQNTSFTNISIPIGFNSM